MSTSVPRNQSLGGGYLLSLLSVHGSGLGPDGPGEPEESETNPVLHAKHLWFQQLSLKKSSTGVVLALSPLLAVYGPGLGSDGPGDPEKP